MVDGLVDGLVDVLRCPVCGGRVHRAGTAVRCEAGHSFDIARQGYVNLLTSNRRPGTADSATMVQARADFLAAGHYAVLADTLAGIAAGLPGSGSDVVVDAGAGTGYYAAAVLDALPSARGLALDISKYAARRAARAHSRLAAAVCDTWRGLPIGDASARLVLNVFAPRNGPEFHRVLAPGGVLVVVTPTGRHLAELRGPGGLLTVDAAKDAQVERALDGRFECRDRVDVEYVLALSPDDAERVVRMGPSAWHVDEDRLAGWRSFLSDPVHVTASFSAHVYAAIER